MINVSLIFFNLIVLIILNGLVLIFLPLSEGAAVILGSASFFCSFCVLERWAKQLVGGGRISEGLVWTSKRTSRAILKGVFAVCVKFLVPLLILVFALHEFGSPLYLGGGLLLGLTVACLGLFCLNKGLLRVG